jgi:hypothetical protein
MGVYSNVEGEKLDFYRVAALIIRLTGLTYITGGVDYLTYLPPYLERASHTQPHTFWASFYQMEVQLLILRMVLHIAFGSVLFLYWKPLAQALTKCIRGRRASLVIEGADVFDED